MSNNKNDIISKIYYDPSGYGSIQNTWKDAHEKDPSIRQSDVKEWFENNIKKKTNVKGQNSFVAPHAYYEFQIDLFFITHLTNQDYTIGMICIDIFSKYCSICPIKSKNESELALGLIECINKMGNKPKIIYTDGETGIRNSAIFEKYFVENNITYIPTKTHPYFAERMILTFKTMLDKRLGNDKESNVQWTKYIYPILLTYNNKMVHSSTGFTPNEARKPENELTVYLNMTVKAKHNRKYPDINIGDKVFIYMKRQAHQKSHVSLWSDVSYEVEDISSAHGISFYKTTARDKPFLRHELLKNNVK